MKRSDRVVPRPLGRGGHVRVVAPARSLAMISPETRAIADARLADLGLRVSFGDHVEEQDPFVSSSITSRVADLHAAFADPSVDAILTVIGGFNSHQLLPHLDLDLIADNPKILCGFSDITALLNAIHAHTGMITYLGPHYSSFGMWDHFGDTLRWFIDATFGGDRLTLQTADTWTDDETWFLDQDDRHPMNNEGWWPLRHGQAHGPIVGGNASTFTLLNGTDHSPPLAGAVLLLEDDDETQPHHFDRWLTSILQQPGADELAGLAIGRFQQRSNMTRDLLQPIVDAQPALTDIPVLANLDVGHTTPMATIPIGADLTLHVTADDCTAAIDRPTS